MKGKWGFIDKKGNFIIKPQFDEPIIYCSAIYTFTNGLAAVCKNRKYGYIDKNGKWIVEPNYDVASGFMNGFAHIDKNNLVGFIALKNVVLKEKN